MLRSALRRPVRVDYGQSVRDVVAAGLYHAVYHECFDNNLFNDEIFPPNGLGVKDVDVYLVELDSGITLKTAAVYRHLDEHDLRPLGDVRELLAIGSHYPHLQQRHPIVTLEPRWRVPDTHPTIAGVELYPALWGTHDRRSAGMRLMPLDEQGWGKNVRFATLRK